MEPIQKLVVVEVIFLAKGYFGLICLLISVTPGLPFGF